MHPFAYTRPNSLNDAVAADIGTDSNGPPTEAGRQFLAGGTTIIDLMRLDVMRPDVLVDLNRLPARDHARIDVGESGLRFGFLTRMADAADDPRIKRDYPVIAESLDLAASPQVRNMATLAGNLLQRTRCSYFRDTAWTTCNKRIPGSGCAALDGINRQHAVLGASDQCIATYPGDFAQALIALDARVVTEGADGGRAIPIGALHRLPGSSPHIETVLKPDELILAIEVPAGPHTRRSHYLKVRDRQSFAFALASAAVALDLDGDAVRDARIALGGVAVVPWRAREAEDSLKGKALDEESARRAAEIAFADARPRAYNSYKVPLGKETLVRALLETKAMEA
jgi:xanthine dehydrogenase YagS FAD-binding subunit